MAVLRLVPSQGSPVPVEITQDKVVVGREPTCDLVVSDGSVSRKHATIERRGNGWAVVDQGSANGTFVDSQRVTERRAAQRPGAALRGHGLPGRDRGTTRATILTGMPEATVIQESPIQRPPAGPRPAAHAGGEARAAAVVAAEERARGDAGPAAAPASAAAAASGAPPPCRRAPRALRRPCRHARPPLRRPARRSAGPPPLPPRAAAASRPAGVRPVGGAPPPAKKGRSPLFWVGGGCCGCLVLVLVFLGIIGGGAFYMTSGAVEVVRAQITDVKKGDMDGAYGRMSEEYRAQHSQRGLHRLRGRATPR